MEQLLFGWHCRWCGKIYTAASITLALNQQKQWFLRPWTCASNQSHMSFDMHLLSSDTVSEYHSSPMPCTTESGSLWWPGRMHSCQVLLPCRWWTWEKLFLYRSLIGIFESLLSFTKISVEVYSNVKRCVSTINCLSTIFLYINHHQLRFLQELRLFFRFPPLHSRGILLWQGVCFGIFVATTWWSQADDRAGLGTSGPFDSCWWTKISSYIRIWDGQQNLIYPDIILNLRG